MFFCVILFPWFDERFIRWSIWYEDLCTPQGLLISPPRAFVGCVFGLVVAGAVVCYKNGFPAKPFRPSLRAQRWL